MSITMVVVQTAARLRPSGCSAPWILRTGALELLGRGAIPDWQHGGAADSSRHWLLFAALYLVGHQEVPSDIPAYYMPAAHAVLAGKLPFRDFTSSYAPLFPYLGGALVWIWDSGKMFALFSILVNAAALLVVAFGCRSAVPGQAGRRGRARCCSQPADTYSCRLFSAPTRPG